MTRLLTTLACALLLPGAALAKPHHHKRHHKPHHAVRHHREAAVTTGWTQIASYQQTAGFGGPLSIARSDGSTVASYFGEKAILRCGPTADGPFAPCDKSNLVPGTPVAAADHGPNQYGNDVWTAIDLVTTAQDAPAEDPPAQDAPAQEQDAPPAIAAVDAYDAGARRLAFHRYNNDERPDLAVSPDVQITCDLVKDGKLEGVKPCSTDDLVPGAQIAHLDGVRNGNVPTITKIELLVDAGS